MKYFLCILIIILSVSGLHSQVDDITLLPFQIASQSVTESAPVWISENEIIIFYVSPERDTIYSTKSNDRGLTWGEPRTVVLIDSVEQSQNFLYPAAVRTNTGRILLAWTVWMNSMKLIYSDDDGVSWSEPISILGGTALPAWKKRSANLNLSQLIDGKIVLSFNVSHNQRSFYRTSTDNGISWSEEVIEFENSSGYHNEVSIISLNDSTLIGVFQKKSSSGDEYGIFKKISYGNGVTWR